MPQLQLKGYIEKVEKEEDGILSVAVATDDSVDRDGERIDASGWDFNNFLKNPVLLWAHNYREEPLGKVVSLVRDGSRILFRAQFAVGISETAKRIFEFYKEGVLNSFSVGFIPREWKDERGNDGEVVRTFTKTELLEISAVPVPANPNALVLARGMSEDAETFLRKEMKDAGIPEPAPAPTPAGEAPPATDDQKILEAVDMKFDAFRKEIKETTDGLAERLEQIKTLIAGIGTDGKSKVEIERAAIAVNVLKEVDKAVGLALRDLNKL